jgi:hypothetical protein
MFVNRLQKSAHASCHHAQTYETNTYLEFADCPFGNRGKL